MSHSVASASRRQTSEASKACVERRRRRRGVPVQLSVARRKSTAENPWVGLLARKVANRCRADSRAASPSPAFGPSGYSKRRAFTHSGGTAPDLHRTSLLRPSWAPKAGRDASTFGKAWLGSMFSAATNLDKGRPRCSRCHGSVGGACSTCCLRCSRYLRTALRERRLMIGRRSDPPMPTIPSLRDLMIDRR